MCAPPPPPPQLISLCHTHSNILVKTVPPPSPPSKSLSNASVYLSYNLLSKHAHYQSCPILSCVMLHGTIKLVNFIDDLYECLHILYLQNRTVMIFGAVCITGCLAFIMYLNATHERTTPSKSVYQKGKTRWDN